MEVYMRLIEEGVFVFWNDESEAHTYNLKISIFVGEKKVTILNKNFESGERYFSLNKIGAGDYEIELNGYEGTRLFQTEVKKCNIKSISQQNSELLEKLESISNSIDNVYYAVNNIDQSAVQDIQKWCRECDELLANPSRYLDSSRWASFVRDVNSRVSRGY